MLRLDRGALLKSSILRDILEEVKISLVVVILHHPQILVYKDQLSFAYSQEKCNVQFHLLYFHESIGIPWRVIDESQLNSCYKEICVLLYIDCQLGSRNNLFLPSLHLLGQQSVLQKMLPFLFVINY